MTSLPPVFQSWFKSRGWSPRAHQLSLLETARAQKDALLIAPTGAGKTLAGFLPSLTELTVAKPNRRALHTLYISPLKALAVDVARNLEQPVAEMGLRIRVETRTGDTSASKRQRQRRDPPDILLTTPEQLSLLLGSAEGVAMFGSLKRVIFDELHAIVSSKRGDLLALDYAHLRSIAPNLRAIGLSRSRVQGMIVTEACLIGLLGGIAGILLSVIGGVTAAAVLRARIGLVVQPDVDVRAAMIVLAGAVLLAGLASILPALLTYRTPVADNLRPSA